MLKVGLTGNIASGKSSVARVWRELGATVIEADELARRAVEPGTPALARIADRWGARLLAPDGSLDRAALRAIVFQDEAERRALEAIVHPAVAALREEEHQLARARGDRVVVSDVPLLFEVGMEGDFDRIVLVDAPEPVRRERLIRDRGLAPDEADRMIAAQMPAARKRSRADLVIENDGTLEELRAAAEKAWRELDQIPAPPLLRVDLHSPTRLSRDCLSDPRAVLRTARARGLDRLAITDHNEVDEALRLHEIDPELVLVGEEVKTGEGFDVIGIFLGERIPKGTPARETCERIHAQGGVVYIPHPFDTLRSGAGTAHLDELAPLIDVVEVHNSRCFREVTNRRAEEWAAARGKLRGAGSDSHTLAEIGHGYVEMPPFEPNRESFLSALASGRVTGRVRSSPLYRAASTYAKLHKRFFPA
jgi:dephospho-CoA kinase